MKCFPPFTFFLIVSTSHNRDEFCVLYRCGDFVKIRRPGDSNETLWGTRKSGTPIRRQLSSPWLLPLAEAGDKILRIDAWTLCDQRQARLCLALLREVPVALIQIIQGRLQRGRLCGRNRYEPRLVYGKNYQLEPGNSAYSFSWMAGHKRRKHSIPFGEDCSTRLQNGNLFGC